jgi:hypothetical protein
MDGSVGKTFRSSYLSRSEPRQPQCNPRLCQSLRPGNLRSRPMGMVHRTALPRRWFEHVPMLDYLPQPKESISLQELRHGHPLPWSGGLAGT